MRLMLTLMAAGLLSFTTIGDVVDRIGVEGPLTFNQEKFNLEWSDKPNDKYFIQEYLPNGEATESFNQMLTIHLFNTDIKVKDAVKQKTRELTQRKKTDPVCNYLVNESPDGKEFIVDFLIGESKGDEMAIVEFNIYRYKQIDIGGTKKGLIVYAYSKRAYGDSITPFLNSLGSARTKYLNEMISTEIPSVTIKEN